jgi:hypothetical protein
MNAFPLLAAVTICVSFAVLYASFEDLREAPLNLDRSTAPMREIAARRIMPSGLLRKAALPPLPDHLLEANEGLLDQDLASDDPVQSWLDRYLTRPADFRAKP